MHNNIVTELSKIIPIKCTNHQFKLNLHFTALNRFTQTACYNQDRLHWNSRQKMSTDDYKQKNAQINLQQEFNISYQINLQ